MISIVISEPVVSVDWLHSNLDAENLIVLERYKRRHTPRLIKFKTNQRFI